MGAEGQFLYDIQATRQWEQAAAAVLPAHRLMRSAGAAVARLSAALAPHARCIWFACGAGNNGGDGLMAAALLHAQGKPVWASWLGQTAHASADTLDALTLAQQVGLPLHTHPPEQAWDFAVDALLGLGGAQRDPTGSMAQWIDTLNAGAPVLAVDLPTGLHPATGQVTTPHVRASHTLSLLTLKPGLFTANGRDACGEIWLDDLGVAGLSAVTPPQACARLNPAPSALVRPHASHKGSWGDVAVVGGATGMNGAVWLAAQSALQTGAGRVLVASLDAHPTPQPPGMLALMQRCVSDLPWDDMTLVCGCGGGATVAAWLPRACASPRPLVLDADALNAIAADTGLVRAVRARGAATVMTPHPLEAARLLGCDVATVQADRLGAAQRLAQSSGATVVLKGSGSVIAQQGRIPTINPTGDARLATAGTGDVLAGAIGALLSQGMAPYDAACAAVYRHGWQAQQVTATVCDAQTLAHRMGRC